jgi:hypothetical protein
MPRAEILRKDLQTEVVWQMLESARLSSSEVGALLDRALDPDHWRHFDPRLTVCATGRHDVDEAHSLDSSEVRRLADKLAIEGYFHTDPVLPLSLIQKMQDCVAQLRGEGWPPVFAFVYDEFWTAVRTASLGQLLSAVLGRGYKQNSIVWTYYVAPRKRSAGWTPHADGGGEQRLTVWIPLTDATLENGCMYVIPRDLVPDSLPTDYNTYETIKKIELGRLLQCCQALPARAGSMLGWDHNLIHWGSMSHGSTTPRVSIGVEFLATHVTPSDYERPLLDSASLPTFPQRLHMIAKGILEYKKFEPLMVRYGELAERLMSRCREDTGIRTGDTDTADVG